MAQKSSEMASEAPNFFLEMKVLPCFHVEKWSYQSTWNPKQPFINGCFNWMIPNLYVENDCFTKHPFTNACLGFQALMGVITPVTDL